MLIVLCDVWSVNGPGCHEEEEEEGGGEGNGNPVPRTLERFERYQMTLRFVKV